MSCGKPRKGSWMRATLLWNTTVCLSPTWKKLSEVLTDAIGKQLMQLAANALLVG